MRPDDCSRFDRLVRSQRQFRDCDWVFYERHERTCPTRRHLRATLERKVGLPPGSLSPGSKEMVQLCRDAYTSAQVAVSKRSVVSTTSKRSVVSTTKSPPHRPRRQIRVVILNEYKNRLAEFLQEYFRRLRWPAGWDVTIDDAEDVQEIVDGLADPRGSGRRNRPTWDVAVGLFRTRKRLDRGLEFIDFPGLFSSFDAVVIEFSDGRRTQCWHDIEARVDQHLVLSQRGAARAWLEQCGYPDSMIEEAGPGIDVASTLQKLQTLARRHVRALLVADEYLCHHVVEEGRGQFRPIGRNRECDHVTMGVPLPPRLSLGMAVRESSGLAPKLAMAQKILFETNEPWLVRQYSDWFADLVLRGYGDLTLCRLGNLELGDQVSARFRDAIHNRLYELLQPELGAADAREVSARVAGVAEQTSSTMATRTRSGL